MNHWSLFYLYRLPRPRTWRTLTLSTCWTLTLWTRLTRSTLTSLSLRTWGALTLWTRWPLPRLTGATVSTLWSFSLGTLTTFNALSAFATSTAFATAALAALAFARGKWWLNGFLLPFNGLAALTGQDIAFINPYFDAYDTEGGMCLCQSIINIGPQGVQGDLPLDLFLRASDFRSAQAATTNDFDTLGVGAHRFLYCLLHSAAKRYTFLQLFCNAAPNQIGRADGFSD